MVYDMCMSVLMDSEGCFFISCPVLFIIDSWHGLNENWTCLKCILCIIDLYTIDKCEKEKGSNDKKMYFEISHVCQ